ncbi:MAG: hypothetical protein CL881_06420 [Dehalococcoidia bacterium]|nr:hypothetical protein [Dehalococcoidia bacterium]
MLVRSLNYEKWKLGEEYRKTNELDRVVVDTHYVYNTSDILKYCWTHVLLRMKDCTKAITMQVPSEIHTEKDIMDYVTNHPEDWNHVFQI